MDHRTEAANIPERPPVGRSPGLFIPWDFTDGPNDNSDRDKKLGSGDGTHGAAIFTFDPGPHAITLVDGLHGAPITSYLQMEPDNWVFRYHTPNAQGRDNVLALRMVSDDQNKDFERENRSTIWMNQCDNQNWAFSRDLFKVKDLAASCSHNEMRLDKAGFVSMMRTTGSPTGGAFTRAALMVNISKRGGYCSDGSLAGQLWHILSLKSAGGGGFSNTGFSTVGNTVTSVTTGGGTTTSTCGSVTKSTLALRGDVNYHVGGFLSRLGLVNQQGGGGDDEYQGWLYPFASFGGMQPASELSEESDVSNQTIIPKENLFTIVPVVPIPRIPWSPIRPPGEVPPNFPSIPTGSTTVPTETTHGAFKVSSFPTAVVSGINWATEIPNKTIPDKSMQVLVNFLTPTGGIGGDAFTIQLDWCAVARGASGAPGALTGTSSASLDSTTYSGNSMLYRKVFTIPNSDMNGKEGGKLSISLYRRGDTDRNTGGLSIIGAAMIYGKKLSDA